MEGGRAVGAVVWLRAESRDVEDMRARWAGGVLQRPATKAVENSVIPGQSGQITAVCPDAGRPVTGANPCQSQISHFRRSERAPRCHRRRSLGRAAWPLSLGGPWALAGAWFIAGARAAGRAPADCKAPAAPPGPGPWAGTGRLAGACKPTGPCLCSLSPPPSQSRVFCAPRLLY